MVDYLDDLFGAARQACRGKELAVDDECRYRAHVVGLEELARLRAAGRDSRRTVDLHESLPLDAVARHPSGPDLLVIERYAFEVKMVVDRPLKPVGLSERLHGIEQLRRV